MTEDSSGRSKRIECGSSVNHAIGSSSDERHWHWHWFGGMILQGEAHRPRASAPPPSEPALGPRSSRPRVLWGRAEMKGGLMGSPLLLALPLLSLSVPAPAGGSSPQETISGFVRDRDGPVAGAIVRVQASGISATTDAQGRFALTGLPAGEPVTLSAWASGFYIAGGEPAFLPGETGVELRLIRHADKDNPAYDWVSAFRSGGSADNCENCHSRPVDPESALPLDEWRRDAHSRSALNKRFLTMYGGTDMSGNRSPVTRKGFSRDYGAFPLPPDPFSPYYGPGYKLDFPETAGNCAACHAPAASVKTPYEVDPTGITGVGAEGVTCDFCHKVWDVRLDESGLPQPNRPGVLSFEFRRPFDGHQFFAGPLDDVAPGEDIYSPLHRQSRFCAPCHFGIFWETTVYNSYGEWLDSPYSDPRTGKTCQDCHMPAGLTDHFALPEKGGRTRDPRTISSHRMPGVSDEELLKDAVSLSLEARREGSEIIVHVDIVNDRTGHHVPTGSPLRQMILVVQAADSQGSRLRQIGGPAIPDWGGVGDPSRGNYAGLPGAIYAKVLQEVWTRVTPSGAYWNPTRVLSDNRIPALGENRTTYRFSAAEKGRVGIEASLIFRRAFMELMKQKGWNTPDILMGHQDLVLE